MAATSAISSPGEGILPEVEVLALKRVVSLQLQQILEKDHVAKTELASHMKTSRASLDWMLDPTNSSLTVASLGKAAAARGRKAELRFVPAWPTHGERLENRRGVETESRLVFHAFSKGTARIMAAVRDSTPSLMKIP